MSLQNQSKSAAAQADPSSIESGGIPSHLHPLSLISRLEWRLTHNPPKRKSDRTRERLKLACARLLDQRGFHDLKAGDVSSEADLSEGSFYLYFTDKRDITRIVLSEFHDLYYSLLTTSGPAIGGAYASIRRSNLIWIAAARANAGLMRCLFQFADEDQAFSTTVQEANMRWHQRIARATLRDHGTGDMPEHVVLLLVYLLGGMMDDLGRKLIVYPDPELLGILDRHDIDDNVLADMTALVWLRILRPKEVPPSSNSKTLAALNKALFPQLSQAFQN